MVGAKLIKVNVWFLRESCVMVKHGYVEKETRRANKKVVPVLVLVPNRKVSMVSVVHL